MKDGMEERMNEGKERKDKRRKYNIIKGQNRRQMLKQEGKGNE